MKRPILAAMLLAAGLFFLSSCESKGPVAELKAFVEKVQEEGGAYTEQQWAEANEEFSQLLEKVNEAQDMTAEELQEVARLQGEFAAKAFKEQAGEALEKAGALLDGFLGGLSDDEDTDNQPQE